MNSLERVFVKARTYVRQFDTQNRLPESQKQANIAEYEKAMKELDDAFTVYITEKVESVFDTKDEEPHFHGKRDNRYFKLNVIGGVELRGEKIDSEFFGVERSISGKDSEFIKLLEDRKIVKCLKKECSSEPLDINHLYFEIEDNLNKVEEDIKKEIKINTGEE